MTSSVRFSRRPYTRVIEDMSGNERIIRRRPSEKLHDILPQDVVELTSRRSDLFPAEATYKVKHISRREPNLLQIESEEGNTAFVPYFDVAMEEAVARRGRPGGVSEHPVDNEYLRWP